MGRDRIDRWWARRLRIDRGSLKLRITLGGIAALLLGIGLIALLLVQRAERDTLRAERQRELSESVRMATILSRRAVSLQRALRSVATQLDPATVADPEALARFLVGKPIIGDMFSGLFVADPDGRVLVRVDGTTAQRPALHIGDRPYFRRTIDEGRALISEPLPGRITGEPIIVFTQPVTHAAGTYAVIGGALRLAQRDLLSDLVEPQDGDTQSLLIVTDAGGRVLAHPQRERLLKHLVEEPRLHEAFAAWVDAGQAVEPAGMTLPQSGEVVTVAGVPGPDWMVWRVRREAELLAPLQSARREALIAAAALVGVMSLLLLGLLHLLLRPLSQLARRAQHLFDGSLAADAGWPQARGEIGHLARVLRRVGTERVQLEAMNSEVLRKLASVMSAAPLGIAFTRDGRFELVSDEFCRLLLQPRNALLGQSTAMIYADPLARETLGPQVREAFQAGRPYDGEWLMRRADGSAFWANLRGSPVDPHDPAAGTIWTLADISAQRSERQQLEWSARHDALTGLANRSVLEARAARLIAAAPMSMPAALVCIDLDRFKPINDSAGHAAGDAMLRAVGEAMASQVRASDLVVRLGGDEFALLLERCSPATALRIAEDVRAAIAGIVLVWEGRPLSVGASLGVAGLDAKMPDLAAWIEAADAACYAAKAAGRDAVRTAPGPNWASTTTVATLV
ncbi:diguanylate cyclase [uncultured Methylibium sp.]|uniref:sensor domain-containing diguanylate cyclase n=1 Tax=uncultured Methylibium sp. TaxID=381093 RepID=UPI0025EA1580|nr:diguanylate cyclase [uncultured Methylibium sp.]